MQQEAALAELNPGFLNQQRPVIAKSAGPTKRLHLQSCQLVAEGSDELMPPPKRRKMTSKSRVADEN